MFDRGNHKKKQSRYRWFVVRIFFFFMLLHQSDKLVIGSLTTQIMDSFGIDEVQMGAVFTGALIVSANLYPLWGYLYDLYAHAKLRALASFIWEIYNLDQRNCSNLSFIPDNQSFPWRG